jgi:hypothetical protein
MPSNCLFLVPLLLLYSKVKEKNTTPLNRLSGLYQLKIPPEDTKTRITQPSPF